MYSVATVVLLAVRDLSSRAVPPAIPSVQLAAWGFLSLVPAGLVTLLIADVEPVRLVSAEWMRLGAILVVGCSGYYSIVAATRTGEVSAVVPFRYTRLLFAMFLALLVFDEHPDGLMITGAALIVGTGLYTIWRSAVRSRRPAPEL
jgi:drug/metabolite transporter (DMT)-like permease